MSTEQIVAVEETVKPKRVRKPVIKLQKTGDEIFNELLALQTELAEMENAIDEIAPNSLFHGIAKDALEAKRDEFTKALNTVYTV